MGSRECKVRFLSIFLSVTIFLQNFYCLALAQEPVTSNLSYSNIYKNLDVFEPETLIEEKIVYEDFSKDGNVTERYIAKRVVDTKYFGCGNLTDLDEMGITFGGVWLGFCDFIYDVTKGKIFGEEILRIKISPHEKLLLEHHLYTYRNFDTEQPLQISKEATKEVETKGSSKYKVTNSECNVYSIDSSVYYTKDLALMREAVFREDKRIADRQFSNIVIEKINEEVSNVKFTAENRKDEISKTDLQVWEIDDVHTINTLEDIKPLMEVSNLKEDTENKVSKITITEDEEKNTNSKNDAKMELVTKKTTDAVQIETTDNLNNKKISTTSEIIEKISIEAGVVDDNNTFGWQRNGIRVRKIGGNTDIYSLKEISVDAYSLDGTKLQIDKAHFFDVGMTVHEGDESISLFDKGTTKVVAWGMKATEVHKYDRYVMQESIVKQSEQEFEYDYLTGKFTFLETGLKDIESNVTVKYETEETTKYIQLFGNSLDESLGKNVQTVYVPTVEEKVVKREKEYTGKTPELLYGCILGEGVVSNKIQPFETLLSKVVCGDELHKQWFFNDDDFKTKKEETLDRAPEKKKSEKQNSFENGSVGEWWFVGGIERVLAKAVLDAPVEWEDFIAAASDGIDIVMICSVVGTGVSLAKRIVRAGIGKIVTYVGEKLTLKAIKRAATNEATKRLVREEVYAFARDKFSEGILIASGHPELAQAVELRHKFGTFASKGIKGLVGKPQIRPRLPKEGFEGVKGNSLYRPNKRLVPKNLNPEGLTIAEIEKKYNFSGIPYKKDFPDFKNVVADKVRIPYFTYNRTVNFDQARDAFVKKFNRTKFMGKNDWNHSQFNKYLKDNHLTMHEKEDYATIELVPSVIHANTPHNGGRYMMELYHYIQGKTNEWLYAGSKAYMNFAR